jgi:MYXO-CTERM domain-containing protein
MNLRARSCAAALVVAGLALYTESARADVAAGSRAAPTCTVSLGATQAAVTLPANAPALLVVDHTYGTTAPTIQAALVNGTTRTELTAQTDAHGLWALSLPSPSPAVGTYNVEIATSCRDLSDEREIVTPLTLTEAVPFPTSVGTLVHVPSNPPTGEDTIRLEPTPGMRAFLAASQLELVVGGVRTGKSTFVSNTSTIELSVNVGDACIENGALHREKRVVKVSLEGAIAGVAESPAPASIDVPVDCGAIEWTSGWAVDDGASPSSPNGTTPSSSPSSAQSSDGGCSAAPVGTRGDASLGAFALGALGLVAMRRRRHR